MTARRVLNSAPTTACGAACPASSTSSQPRLSSGSFPNIELTEANVVETSGITRNSEAHKSGNNSCFQLDFGHWDVGALRRHPNGQSRDQDSDISHYPDIAGTDAGDMLASFRLSLRRKSVSIDIFLQV
jgi:hypothetical protein